MLANKKNIEVIQALQLADWRFPRDGVFTDKFRDDLALFGNKADCDFIRKVVAHYDYSKLYLGEFLYAEFAYYKTVCQ